MKLTWTKLGVLPGSEGLAGTFAGRQGDWLFVAGGTNFPDKPMTDGGERCWHDRIHLYNLTDRAWKEGGKWPTPITTGGSVTSDRGIVCVGGSNAAGAVKKAWLVSIAKGQAVLTALPDLPKPLSGMAIVARGSLIFVLGGQHEAGPFSTSDFLCLDLSRPSKGWRALPPLPSEGIMNCVLTATASELYVFGGIRIEKEANVGFVPPYLNEGWIYREKTGWEKIADLPHPSGAAPSPALSWDGTTFYLLGGADGSHMLKSPRVFEGFPRRIMVYDKSTDKWSEAGEMPAAPLVAPVIPGQKKDYYLLGGETGPGLRAREIWHITAS